VTEGVVARVDLRGVVVLDDTGALEFVPVRKRLMDPGARLGNAIVVGDRVTVAEGSVATIAPRRNAFQRAAAGASASGRLQVTAANLDRVLAVVALKDPPLSEGLVDRFAITAEFLGIPLALAFTKADLASEDEIAAAQALYARAGYDSYVIAAKQGAGIEALARALAGSRTLLVGHSGVGKSTLLNALVPGLELKIGEVNAKTGKGRHTTTAATLLRIAPGPPPTEVIDTPGVRAFGLPRVSVEQLARLFPECRDHGACRFSDCSHRSEPDCAVRAALEGDGAGRARYAAYLRLRAELEGAAPPRDAISQRVKSRGRR
jgi:ribosome biogenesis GTPase